jgi:sugar phosphate isomerase/epimerase
MKRLGLEMISAFGLPPVDYVRLAAELGCAHVSLAVSGAGINPHGYAAYDLRLDAPLRRALQAELAASGVAVSMAEGFTVRPDTEMAGRTAEFDLFAELGARRINLVSLEPDWARTCDQFGVIAGMAAARGMGLTMEFAPGLTVHNLPLAMEMVRQIGRDDVHILIDTMHLYRSGGTAADVAALPPGWVDYVQISDVPLVSSYENYMQEAMTDRKRPGEGELPLADILAAVPRDCPVSMEIPLLAEAKAGIGPYDRLWPAAEAVRALLANLNDERERVL